jgi:hypothetical protein
LSSKGIRVRVEWAIVNCYYLNEAILHKIPPIFWLGG